MVKNYDLCPLGSGSVRIHREKKIFRLLRRVALIFGSALRRLAERLLRVGRGQTGKYGQFPPGYIHGSQTAHLNTENGNLEIRSWNTDGYQSVSTFPRRTDPEYLAIVADRERRLRQADPSKIDVSALSDSNSRTAPLAFLETKEHD